MSCHKCEEWYAILADASMDSKADCPYCRIAELEQQNDKLVEVLKLAKLQLESRSGDIGLHATLAVITTALKEIGND
jgi:hypothetical protein